MRILAASIVGVLLLQAPTAVQAAERRGRRIASAPTITTHRTSRDLPVDDDQSGTGLALFVGAGPNYYSVLGSTAGEADKSGSGYQGRAALTLFSRNLAVELGVGWLSADVQSSTSTKSLANGSLTSTSGVTTKAGFVEFSPRYKVGDHFEIGPSAGAMFGTNASFGITASTPNSPILAGLKMAGTWETKQLHFRMVAHAQTSLSIPERRVVMAGIGLEIGLPLLRGKTIVRETEVKQIEDRREVEYIETPVEVEKRVEIEKRVEVVLFSFDDQVVHFEFDRAQVAQGSRAFVGKLGAFLAANPSLWSSLKIEGHTDNRGSADYNQRLSAERAQAVAHALTAAGVPADKLASNGLGLSSPIDRGPSDISHARNRRVELSFTDVTDPRVLRDAITRIRFETATPATCAGGHCR